MITLRRGIRLVSVLLFSLAACVTPRPDDSPMLQPTSPLAINSPLRTPAASVPFRLEKPIVEGTDVVRGTGPAGVPIIIADVTFLGEILGLGVIGPDGTFAVNVPVLEKNHRIGVALGDLTGTSWKMEDFSSQAFWGDEAMQVPQVGFFYDTFLVREK